MQGRVDEHPAVLDAGLGRAHAADRHPDAERGVDVPRRERRSAQRGAKGARLENGAAAAARPLSKSSG